MTLRAVLPRLLFGLAILVAVVGLALKRDLLEASSIESTVRNLGLWAPVAHVALFALGTVRAVCPGRARPVAPNWTASAPCSRSWPRSTRSPPTAMRARCGAQTPSARPENFGDFDSVVMAPVSQELEPPANPGRFSHAGREVVAGNETAIRYGLMGLALLAAVAFVPHLLRRLKSEQAVRWIEVEELAPRLAAAKAIAVIDVRGPDEFAGPLGHIPNARNLPLADLPLHLDELGSLAETPVALVCKTDKRSASAATLLGSAGLRDVVVLRGGMVRWNEARLPVADRISSNA
jgi:rhodanese-related sulfurtransferase